MLELNRLFLTLDNWAMDPRISTLESDVATIRANVEVIRADYVVKADVLASEHRLDLKIDRVQHELDTKIDRVKYELETKIDGVQHGLETQIADTENRLQRKLDAVEYQVRFDTILPTLATKADFLQLSVSVRNWVLGTVLALFLSFGTMVVTMYKLMKPAIVAQPAASRAAQSLPLPKAPSAP
ncbi:MAG: hypothetical protein Q8R69_22715 [Telluria sp.]|nr:hypothetical protein [Telluria sp.]